MGLCIALFDITSLKESFIIPGDGASHTIVHFRYIVFRPFLEEILVGKIRSCSQEGVHGKGLWISKNSLLVTGLFAHVYQILRALFTPIQSF